MLLEILQALTLGSLASRMRLPPKEVRALPVAMTAGNQKLM